MTEKQAPADDFMCKGAWELGTACGECPRCVATKPSELAFALHSASRNATTEAAMPKLPHGVMIGRPHEEVWTKAQVLAFGQAAFAAGQKTAAPDASLIGEGTMPALIVRDVCELDPATEGRADTVSVSCADLLRIIARHLADAQAQVWSSGPPPKGDAVWAWHPDLVHEDFNPTGVVEAMFDGSEWVGAVRNGQSDIWNTLMVPIAMWRPIAGPVLPEAIAQAAQS